MLKAVDFNYFLSLWSDSRIRYRSAVNKSIVCCSTQRPEFDLQESTAPGSMQPNRAKVSVWEVSVTLVHTLPAAPPPLLGSAPPPHMPSACSYLVRYFQTQTVNNGREQTTTTELKNAPPLPMSKRRNKKTDKENLCENKELDRAREKTRINIIFRGGGSCGIYKDSRAMQS